MNTKTLVYIVAAVVISAGLSAQAAAELVPIGPFTGELSESWESFPTSAGGENPTLLPDPTPIMGGAAAISSPYSLIYQPGVLDYSLGSSGVPQVSDGVKGMVYAWVAPAPRIVFAQPVVRFGAFWGALTDPLVFGDPAVVAVSFMDESNAVIGTVSFEYSRSASADGMLEWHGWASDTPIRTVMYSEEVVAVDGLQANPVPEPALFLPLSCCALLLARRTRRFAETRFSRVALSFCRN